MSQIEQRCVVCLLWWSDVRAIWIMNTSSKYDWEGTKPLKPSVASSFVLISPDWSLKWKCVTSSGRRQFAHPRYYLQDNHNDSFDTCLIYSQCQGHVMAWQRDLCVEGDFHNLLIQSGCETIHRHDLSLMGTGLYTSRAIRETLTSQIKISCRSKREPLSLQWWMTDVN